MTETTGVSFELMQWIVGGLAAWNAFLTVMYINMRVQLVGQYHSKIEVDAIVERLAESLVRQMKAEINLVLVRVGMISAALKIPEPRNDQSG